MIEIKFNTDPLKALMTDLERECFPQAARRSVNRTAASAESHAIQQVAKGSGLRRKVVRQAFSRTRATLTNLVAIVTSTGRHIPLIEFNARQTRKGVTANAWGKRRLYQGVFITKMKSGHVGVYKRAGKGSLPIKELWGPAIPNVMAEDAIAASITAHGQDRLERELRTNLAYFVQRAIKRRRGGR